MKVRGFLTTMLVFVLLIVFMLLFAQPARAAGTGAIQDPPITLPKLTADLLIALTGSLLSVICYLIPPVQRWLTNQLGEWTPLFMAGILLVVACGYQALWCMAWICFITSWQTILIIWAGAIGTNFAAYKAVVKPAKDRAKASALLAAYNTVQYPQPTEEN